MTSVVTTKRECKHVDVGCWVCVPSSSCRRKARPVIHLTWRDVTWGSSAGIAQSSPRSTAERSAAIKQSTPCGAAAVSSDVIRQRAGENSHAAGTGWTLSRRLSWLPHRRADVPVSSLPGNRANSPWGCGRMGGFRPGSDVHAGCGVVGQSRRSRRIIWYMPTSCLVGCFGHVVATTWNGSEVQTVVHRYTLWFIGIYSGS